MKTIKNSNKNLEETAPELFSISKENPFGVPENYFENLSDTISNHCLKTEKQEISIISGTFSKFFIPLAFAASIVLFILIFTRKDEINPVGSYSLAYTDQSSTAEYLEYLINNDELDESLIISTLIHDDTSKNVQRNNQNNESIKALNENPVILTDSLSNIIITEDDIIQYLLEDDDSDNLFN